MKAVPMVGRRFVRWTVLDEVDAPPDIAFPERYFLCRCDCGEHAIVRGANLRKGTSRSCGCLLREERAKRGRGARGRFLGAKDVAQAQAEATAQAAAAALASALGVSRGPT